LAAAEAAVGEIMLDLEVLEEDLDLDGINGT
jgi:hypothetical protein